MFDYSLALPLTRALSENSIEHEFTTLYTQTAEPVNADATENKRDVVGIHEMGHGGGKTANSLVVYPYAMSEPGSQFFMRIYGWRVIGNDPATCIWLRTILGQWACTVGIHAGFKGRVLYDGERFCGFGYDIMQLYVPVLGCAKIQFEFAKDDDLVSIGMNALWARAT